MFGAILLLAGTGPAWAGAQVRIVQPAPGATVEGAAVPIVLAVDGAGLPDTATAWPGPGEFHVALDDMDVLQTTEMRFTLMAIPPGAHRLQVTLEDSGSGSPASPVITFTAQSSAPPAGASWYLGGAVAVAVAVIFVGLLLLWVVWVRPQRVEVLPDTEPDAAAEDSQPAEAAEQQEVAAEN